MSAAMGVRCGVGSRERRRAGECGEHHGKGGGRRLDLKLPNATVTILGPLQMEATADSDGEFVVPNLKPGVYKLRVQVPGFFSSDLEIAVMAGKEASLGHVVLEVKSSAVYRESGKARYFR